MIELRYLVTHRNDYFKTQKSRELQYRIGVQTPDGPIWSDWETVEDVHRYEKE